MNPSSASHIRPVPRRFRWRLNATSVITVTTVSVLVLLALLAIFADWLAPYNPLQQNLIKALQGPSAQHWLGTDDLGRDVLSRLIYGCRIAIIAAAEATAIAIILGVPLGLFIGYKGGWWDWVVMRMVEAIVSIPGIMVAIVIIALLGPGLHRAMIALGILFSTSFLRLARGVVLAEREEVYVRSARVVGAPDSRILLRHILPNIAPPLIVQVTLTVGAVLLAEAGLSFIGLGVQPPNASWGTMLNTAAAYMDLNWFLAIPPGLAIIVTVLSVNLLGDVIRDSIGRGIAVGPRSETATASTDTDVPAAGAAANPLPPREDEVLRVEGLRVVVGEGAGVPVITDLSFGISRGETMGLVGESGSGKTMTGLAILGLMSAGLRTTQGSIVLNGKDLRTLSRRQIEQVRGNEVAMVFQDPTTSLNPAFTVGSQIAEVLRTRQGLSQKQAWARVVELIDRVGIPRPEERARAYPHELSGGMAQRIAIARALSCNPSLLIADEPTTALDVTVQQEILDLFRDLQDEFGMAILFVTHDLAVAADICDRISVMYAGEMVETAEVGALFASPRHPYTRGLLSAMPHASDRNPPLPTIRGNVPRPGSWPTGCRFSNRCDFRIAACEARVPLTGTDRLVRCIRADELQLERAS
ncbi:dipeptide/oligopeptide/nickel ABC transporter permease/ATP-binding protein [Mesorhizobium microcysteis]|uniref:Dipeptide/oligopeptide/nickel ABC transporter permease/ATP-binding protein n=1 Tax=Neoaquamicrobium microcysteis TaxID=2682781 RepID=A0A5D4GTB1_9HYPH|nr:dipeptide/oligopeptide/nickel ABC transporter permease/ATP-binding protein [Mesorhizobium microcysteis]TYR31588.1 dipeptide/oligopeptide/nickel ABC transporter permease/ATP-binding protein [Mesorhizobium microcysteis]